jgi:hypothetical protein
MTSENSFLSILLKNEQKKCLKKQYFGKSGCQDFFRINREKSGFCIRISKIVGPDSRPDLDNPEKIRISKIKFVKNFSQNCIFLKKRIYTKNAKKGTKKALKLKIGKKALITF